MGCHLRRHLHGVVLVLGGYVSLCVRVSLSLSLYVVVVVVVVVVVCGFFREADPSLRPKNLVQQCRPSPGHTKLKHLRCIASMTTPLLHPAVLVAAGHWGRWQAMHCSGASARFRN